MNILIDNQTVYALIHNQAKLANHPYLFEGKNDISFKWPSLLEYLGLGSLLSELPPFDQNQPLFQACIATLCVNEEKDVIHYIYDRLFVENLNQIKALPQMSASFLLQAIKKQRAKSSVETEKLFGSTLLNYEVALIENSSHTMHDLILYLAWDRMCVWMGHIFNYQSIDAKFISGLAVLKECLIESYQHITHEGRTSPGIYRMLETLFFYEMREENLQRHTDEEWTLLSQSFPILKDQNELIDYFYIDDAITESSSHKEHSNWTSYLTVDSSEKFQSRLAFAQCMMHKIKEVTPGWNFILQPKEILYLD